MSERLLREAHVSKQLEDLSHVVVRMRYLAVVEGDEMGQVPRRDPGFNLPVALTQCCGRFPCLCSQDRTAGHRAGVGCSHSGNPNNAGRERTSPARAA